MRTNTLHIAFHFLPLFYLFEFKNLDTEKICKQICKENQMCVKSCLKPLNPEKSSDISYPGCGISKFNEATNRILNGKTAEPHKYPWMVSINSDINEVSWIPIWKNIIKKILEGEERMLQMCGGALIHPQYVLTAAHCVTRRTKSYEVALGINSLNKTNSKAQIVKFDKIIIHNGSFLHKLVVGFDIRQDIALIRLKERVNLTMMDDKFIVNTICLPKSNGEITEKYAQMGGWGLTSYNQTVSYDLQDSQYLIISKKTCKTIYDETIKYNITNSYDSMEVDPQISQLLNNETFQEYFANMFCIQASVPPGVGYRQYSNTPFPGDSGSSLIQYYDNRAHTIGLVSNGPPPAFNIPVALFTKVSLYIDWIRDNIED